MRMEEWLEQSRQEPTSPWDTMQRMGERANEAFNEIVGGWFGDIGSSIGRRVLEQPIDATSTVGSVLHEAGAIDESTLDSLYPKRPGEFSVSGSDFLREQGQAKSGSVLRDFLHAGMGVDQFIPSNVAKLIDPEGTKDMASPWDFGRWTEAPSMTGATRGRLNREWQKRTGHDAPWYLQAGAAGLGFAGDVFLSPAVALDASSYSKASLHALRGPIGKNAATTAAQAPEIVGRAQDLGTSADEVAEAGRVALASFPDLSVRDLTGRIGIEHLRDFMVPIIRAKALGNTEEGGRLAEAYADTVIRNAQDLASRNIRTFVPIAVRFNHHLQRTMRELPDGLRTPRTVSSNYDDAIRSVVEAAMDTPRLRAALRSVDDFPFDEMQNTDPSEWTPRLMEQAKDHIAREATLEDFSEMIQQDDTWLESVFGTFSARRSAHMPPEQHRAIERVVVSNKFLRTRGHTDAQEILRGVGEDQKRAVYMMTQMNPFYITEDSFNDVARTLAGTIAEGDVPFQALNRDELTITPMSGAARQSMVFNEQSGAEELLKTFVGDLGENFDWKMFSPGTEEGELMDRGLATEMERLFRMGQDRLESGSFRDLPINSMYTAQDPIEARQLWRAAGASRRPGGPDISFTVRERPDDDFIQAMRGHVGEALENMDEVTLEFNAPSSYGIPTERATVRSIDDLDRVFSQAGITPFSIDQLSKSSKWLGVDTRDKLIYALRQSGELPADKAEQNALLARALGKKQADSPPGFDIRDVNMDELPSETRKLLQIEGDMQKFFRRKRDEAQEILVELGEALGESPDTLSGMIGDLGYGYWPQRTAMMRRVFRTATDKRRGHLQSFMRMAQHARPVEQLLISPVGQTPLRHNIGDAGHVMSSYSQEVANLHLYKGLVQFAKKYGVRTEFNMASAAAGYYPLSRIKPAGQAAVDAARADDAVMGSAEQVVRETVKAIQEGKTKVGDSDVANLLLKQGIDGADKDLLLPGVEDYVLPKGVDRFLQSHLAGEGPGGIEQHIPGWRNAHSWPRRQALTTVPWLMANAVDQFYSFALSGPRRLDKYIAGAQTTLGAYADDMVRNMNKSAPRTSYEAFKTMQNRRIADFLDSLAGGSKHGDLRKQIMSELQEGFVGGEGWAQHMRHGKETSYSWMNPQEEQGAVNTGAKWFAREIDGAHSLFMRMGGGMEDFARKIQYAAMRLEGDTPMDAQDALSKGFVNYNATALSAFDEYAKDSMYFWTYWKQRPEQLGSAMLRKPWTVWWPFRLRMQAEDAFATDQEKILSRGAPDYVQRQPDYVRMPWDFGPMKLIDVDDQTKNDFMAWMRWRISPLETTGDIRDLTGVDDAIEGDTSSAIYNLFSRSAPAVQAAAAITRGEVMEGVKSVLPLIARAQAVEQWMTPYSDATEEEINETRRIFNMPRLDTMPEIVGDEGEKGLDERLWELRHKKQALNSLGFIVHFENKGNLATQLGREDFRELNEYRRENGMDPFEPTSKQISRWGYGTELYGSHTTEQE